MDKVHLLLLILHMTLFLFYSSSGIPICEKIDPKTVNNQYFFISVLNMVNNFILKLKD